MRPGRRLSLALVPWSIWSARSARAQPNAQTAAGGGPGRQQRAEVQAGAGTLGDVTTGSSGKPRDGGSPKASSGSGGAASSRPSGDDRAGSPAAGRDARNGAR